MQCNTILLRNGLGQCYLVSKVIQSRHAVANQNHALTMWSLCVLYLPPGFTGFTFLRSVQAGEGVHEDPAQGGGRQWGDPATQDWKSPAHTKSRRPGKGGRHVSIPGRDPWWEMNSHPLSSTLTPRGQTRLDSHENWNTCKVDENEWEWIRAYESGWEPMRGHESGLERMRVDWSAWEWIRVYESGLERMRVD